MSAEEVRRRIREYIQEGSDNPDLRNYASGIVGDMDRFLWFTAYMMRLGNIYGCQVLDIGCGFGWQAATISMLGGNHVVANDIRETMIGTMQERISALRSEGVTVDVEALLGDVCTMDLPAGTFDAIVCNQTIEHVHDMDAMLAKCAHVLKPGGRLVIADDNNALNRESREENLDMWEKRDRSWAYIEELKRERPIENKDIKPYAVLREEIVRAANSSLDAISVSRIVSATAGLTKSEIERISKSYTDKEQLPRPPKFSWCRNPISGEYCERQLHPYETAQQIERHGFQARVVHAFRRFPLSLLNAVRLPALSEILFNLRPIFLISATKTGKPLEM
jgi:2-polyprenyl-3-methyl-5-hydroxy-6-metoxy-1,4-benzoquinol methylase